MNLKIMKLIMSIAGSKVSNFVLRLVQPFSLHGTVSLLSFLFRDDEKDFLGLVASSNFLVVDIQY